MGEGDSGPILGGGRGARERVWKAERWGVGGRAKIGRRKRGQRAYEKEREHFSGRKNQ